jgi:alkylated DNA repair dioxygenase AlkB
MKKIDIDGGILYFEPNFYNDDTANSIFEILKSSVNWESKEGVFGKAPRLISYYSDPGFKYAYSGITHHGHEWDEVLNRIKNKVEKFCKITFNSLLLNYYRDGFDSIGWHADNEPELGKNPIIPSISIGQERTFMLKSKKSGEKISFELNSGSLIVMAGATQSNWLHSIPKQADRCGGRINLTFRNILF